LLPHAPILFESSPARGEEEEEGNENALEEEEDVAEDNSRWYPR
jgi:hypothetical protein